MEIVMIMVAIGAIAAVVAYALGNAFGGKAVVWGLGVLGAIAAFLWAGLAQATGYDAIGWAVLLIGGVGPASAGFGVGGLAGWQLRSDTSGAE